MSTFLFYNKQSANHLHGRSAILDVHAIDRTKKEFDVEIQRSDANEEIEEVKAEVMQLA